MYVQVHCTIKWCSLLTERFPHLYISPRFIYPNCGKRNVRVRKAFERIHWCGAARHHRRHIAQTKYYMNGMESSTQRNENKTKYCQTP